jgi:hypothetical protein
MGLPLKICQALFLALAVFYVNASRYSSSVTGYRRAAKTEVDTGCPAAEISAIAKISFTQILQNEMKSKSEELVNFNEKNCKGRKCFKKLFTKLTCKCQIRGKKNEGMLMMDTLFM